DRPADTPSPRADRAPSIRGGPRLAVLQRQTNYAFRPAVRPVRLNIGVAQRRITPATTQQLANEIKSAPRPAVGRRGLCRLSARRKRKRQVQQDRARRAGFRGQVKRELHLWAIRILANRAHDALHDGGAFARGSVRFRDSPGYCWRVLRYAAIDLVAIKI